MSNPAIIRLDFVENEELFLEAYDRLPAELRVSRNTKLATPLLILVGVVLVGYRCVDDYRAENPLWWLGLVIGPIIVGLIWFWSLSRQAHRRAFIRGLRRHFEGGSRRGSATFNEAGFVSMRDDGRSKEHAWSDVPRVILRPDGCFVFIDETTSFWFPKRVFESESAYQRLEALLVRHVARIERLTA
jgi:hypothetical protein